MTHPTPQIFDRWLRRMRKARATRIGGDYFLADWCRDQITERLNDITRNFQNILIIGGRNDFNLPGALYMDIAPGGNSSLVGEEDMLPFADNSFDLAISNFMLHSVNDLPGALLQINRVLKPDGAFIAALPGENTLHELRDSLGRAETDVRGGISPRIAPFTTKQDMGALMQRAGFALPVVDSEKVSVTYPSLKKLMHDLRGMGESNYIAARDKKFAPRTLFSTAEQYYRQNYSDKDGRLQATFEIIFLIGWAPHDSQQRPLKPGSAEKDLSEVL